MEEWERESAGLPDAIAGILPDGFYGADGEARLMSVTIGPNVYNRRGGEHRDCTSWAAIKKNECDLGHALYFNFEVDYEGETYGDLRLIEPWLDGIDKALEESGERRSFAAIRLRSLGGVSVGGETAIPLDAFPIKVVFEVQTSGDRGQWKKINARSLKTLERWKEEGNG